MKTIVALSLALILAACTTSPTGRSQFMVISPGTAIAESKGAYVSTVDQLQRENKLLHDPLLADRVRVITGRLVATAVELYPHSAAWQWSVALIDEAETVNAWCMAGGRMAVYSGLFEKLQLTDDEFAQIMGHEISHALANHTAERMSMALAIEGLTGSLLSVAGGTRSVAEMAANVAIGLPNNRTQEAEADRMGLELATLAGYDPRAAVSLWQKMTGEGGARLPEFLATHPAPANRATTLTRLAAELGGTRPARKRAPHPVQILQGSG